VRSWGRQGHVKTTCVSPQAFGLLPPPEFGLAHAFSSRPNLSPSASTGPPPKTDRWFAVTQANIDGQNVVWASTTKQSHSRGTTGLGRVRKHLTNSGAPVTPRLNLEDGGRSQDIRPTIRQIRLSRTAQLSGQTVAQLMFGDSHLEHCDVAPRKAPTVRANDRDPCDAIDLVHRKTSTTLHGAGLGGPIPLVEAHRSGTTSRMPASGHRRQILGQPTTASPHAHQRRGHRRQPEP
jgi:hypothetical protein